VRRSILISLAALLGLLAAAVPASASAGLVAPPDACPGGVSPSGPAAAQEQGMLCMVNYARAQAGEQPLSDNGTLTESASDKSRDVLECDSFSHTACGREFTYWMRATGYLSMPCWRVGENLAWGAGEYGSVRSIFRAWLRSPEHRANILGEYAETGIDVRTGTLGGIAGTRVWAEHFGSSC
jgi:uncharacterized protein YkwD